MSMNSIPVFQVLRDTMSMLSARQKVLARNIANADTPGYKARDIDQKTFQSALEGVIGKSGKGAAALALKVTEPGHLRAHNSKAGGPALLFKTVSAPDSETSVNGNSVVLEEQVSRVAQTRMRYEAAAGLYEKSMGLLRLALSRPGR